MSSGYEMGSEHLCYVHCNFCNTVLVVSVPSSSLFKVVTVRCGNCTNILQVNMAAYAQQNQNINTYDQSSSSASSSVTTYCEGSTMSSYSECEDSRTSSHRQSEKKQRVPSAYNRFIKDEIQRIKASNPEISHKEAFSTAAKNWAHYPNIHFGLTVDNRRPARVSEPNSQNN